MALGTTIKSLKGTDPLSGVVRSVSEGAYNYMKSGHPLRQVVDKLNDVALNRSADRHEIGAIYEQILSDLRGAGSHAHGGFAASRLAACHARGKAHSRRGAPRARRCAAWHEYVFVVRPLSPGARRMPFFERDTHFAKHVIVRLLGVGRTAEVYEVVAPDGEHRALKVSKPGLPLPSKPQIRLGQEGEAIASIEHVNVVRFYDAGVEDGRVWLLLELVVGPNLQQLVELCGGTLAVERAVSLVRQACEGVAAAHALGILHRDLKPENILVAAGDRALVADFGSAHVGTLGVKTTAREQDLSSSLYTAPERMLKHPAEERSDVYAMAVVLYEAVAGVHPMAPGPTTAMALVVQHLAYHPPPLDTLGRHVPGDVSDLVRRAMSKAPAQRPSMREMADGLAGALWRLHAPRRAVAAGLPLPNRPIGLAPTEPAMTAFGAGGTVRMEAFVDWPASGGAGDRSAVPAPAPVPVSGGGQQGAALSSGAPTRRSRVETTVAMIAVAEDERGSTTVPVEGAATRVCWGPRAVPVAIGGVGAVVLVGLLAVGWVAFGRSGSGGTAPGGEAPGASAGVTAAPSVAAVASVAVPVPAASASAGRTKAPQRRHAVPQPGRLPF
jgi:tRNA A-37 threonylcarbamoyl transferase component Bud32